MSPTAQESCVMTLESLSSFPNVICTVIISRIIKLYKQFCSEVNYTPLSDANLYNYRVGNACAASQRKSLSGLDNMTADGLAAFQTLAAILNRLDDNGIDSDWVSQSRQHVTSSKQYMKLDYKAHLQRSDLCPDHCLEFAFSDPATLELQAACSHDHNLVCDRCQAVKDLFACKYEKYLQICVVVTDITRPQQSTADNSIQCRIYFQILHS